MTTTVAIDVLKAAEILADRVREDYPDLPRVVFTLASAVGKHGHFAPLSWDVGGTSTHEIFLTAESLARGPEGTMGTILHEFAHALANARGIKDTSNRGVYHNAKFRDLGAELGIKVEQMGHHGWSKTSLPDITKERYASEFEILKAAIKGHRRGYVPVDEGDPPDEEEKQPAAAWKMVCPECDDPVRVSKKWFEANTPVCGVCNEPYDLVFE